MLARTTPGSHKDKVMGSSPLYAAPEVVTAFGGGAGVLRPSMDTYSVGLVALQACTCTKLMCV